MEMNGKNIALITENCLDGIVGGFARGHGGGGKGGAKDTDLQIVAPDGLVINVLSPTLKMAEVTEIKIVTGSGLYKDKETIILEF